MTHAQLAALCLIFLPACAASGTGSPPAPFRPIAGSDGLLLWSAGSEQWLVDGKDARLKAALVHMDERVRELPSETGESDIPVEALTLGLDLLASPMSLRAGLVTATKPGAMPFAAQLDFHGATPEATQRWATRIDRLLATFGLPAAQPDAAQHGLTPLPAGPMSAWRGIALDGDGTTFTVGMNSINVTKPDLGTLDLPSGVEPCAAFKLDLGQILQAASLAGAPQDALMTQLFGETPMVFQGGMGHGPDRAYGSMRAMAWKSTMQRAGMLPDGPIPRAALELVPEDATWMTLSRSRLDGTLSLMRTIAQHMATQQGAGEDFDPIEMIKNQIGLDLESDVTAHMGQTFGAYMSDSTGGGGWLSMTLFAEVKNPAGVRELFEWIDEHVDELGSNLAHGYVRMRAWNEGTIEGRTLSFPGFPVPLEISYALEGNWMFSGLSSTGVRTAAARVKSHASSLLDNDRFRELQSGSLDDLMSVSFLDNASFLDDGYGLVNMACSAIGNAMNSPRSAERTPLGILPPFAELARGAKGSVTLGRVQGDDMVVTSQSDRSALVTLTGMGGLVGVPVMLAMGGGILAGSQREQEAHAAALRAQMEFVPAPANDPVDAEPVPDPK